MLGTQHSDRLEQNGAVDGLPARTARSVSRARLGSSSGWRRRAGGGDGHTWTWSQGPCPAALSRSARPPPVPRASLPSISPAGSRKPPGSWPGLQGAGPQSRRRAGFPQYAPGPHSRARTEVLVGVGGGSAAASCGRGGAQGWRGARRRGRYSHGSMTVLTSGALAGLPCSGRSCKVARWVLMVGPGRCLVSRSAGLAVPQTLKSEK